MELFKVTSNSNVVMKPIEYVFQGTLNLILLSMSAWEFIDPIFKVLATIAGIVLTFFLIRKAYHDTKYTKAQTHKLELENELKDQELYERRKKNL